MRLGILEMVGLAGTLIFALPVGIYGVGRLLAGEVVLGGVLVTVAALMVLLPQRVTTPEDVPGAVASRVVGDAVDDPDDSDSSDDASREE